jgi:hypothetical protein
LAFHHGKFIREGVESLHNKALSPCFDIDPTHGAYRQTPPSGKPMKQTSGVSVVAKFLLERPKLVGLNPLELKTGFVADAVGTLKGIGSLAMYRVRKQTPLHWQGGRCSRRDLAQRQPRTLPADHMPAAGDGHLSLKQSPLKPAHSMLLEQLWMQGTPIELKDEFCNAGTG